MEQILLTPKERTSIIKEMATPEAMERFGTLDKAIQALITRIAQAQLKKVMTDAPWKITTIGEERSMPNKTQIRFLFEDEWQAISKEVES